MQGFQYANIRTWSRSGKSGGGTKRLNGERAWTARQVKDEAGRVPGASQHVPVKGMAPIILPGTCKDLAELDAAHERACEVKETYTYTTPKTREKTKRKRKIRKDTHTLYSAVFSLPIKSEDARRDPALMREAMAGIEAYVAWQRKRLEEDGGELCLSVVHLDEQHVHVHVFGLDLENGHVRDLHPGVAARRRVEQDPKLGNMTKSDRKNIADRAYCDAMRGWQDEVHREVSAKLGLLRYGPKRGKLTRAEYMQSMALAEENARLHRENQELKKEMRLRQEALHFKEEIAKIGMAEASARLDHADRKEAEADRTLDAARQTKADADATVAAIADFSEAAPGMLASGALTVVEAEDGPTLEVAKDAPDRSAATATVAAAKRTPKQLVSAFLGLWARGAKAARDAEQAKADAERKHAEADAGLAAAEGMADGSCELVEHDEKLRLRLSPEADETTLAALERRIRKAPKAARSMAISLQTAMDQRLGNVNTALARLERVTRSAFRYIPEDVQKKIAAVLHLAKREMTKRSGNESR